MTHLVEVLQVAERVVLDQVRELLSQAGLVEEFKRRTTSISMANRGGRVPTLVQCGLLIRFLFSCLVDADRTDSADFESHRGRSLRQPGNYAGWELLANRLEDYLSNLKSIHPVDALRGQISHGCFEAAKNVGGVFTLTVPTGGGKTLASLRFALQHALRRTLDRILYVIPYTSIIDQNAEVIRKILDPDNHGKIVLEHHSNLMPERQSWRQKILSENWDAPVVLTTMVQFLDSLFGAGTRGARRMHQMANCVIVFDEVQTLPIKCIHLFNNAINFLAEQCNSTVVLCTATQPLLHKVSAERGAIRLSEKHDLVPDVKNLFDRLKRVEIIDARRPRGWTHEAVAELALKEVRREGSCLVVLNTKKCTRKVYEFASELDACERVHLSTHMCPAHRKERLDYVRERLDRGLPILCVSTQLIEAGVDVDFHVVLRALAGIDSIAQAAGRCNRNGRSTMGRVHVVNITEEPLNSLPEIKAAAKIAERLLDDFPKYPDRYKGDPCSPQALEDYYHYYFFDRQADMSYMIPPAELGHEDTVLNLLAENKQAVDDYRRKYRKGPPIHFRQAFSTAANAFKVIDAPTEGIIVPFSVEGRQLIVELCSAFEVEKQYELLRRAQQFTVNLFPQMLQALKAAHAAQPVQEDVGVQYLDGKYYSNEYGVVAEQISGMELLDV
jgi:CRISPR-associated endonuclease/helicase Cas3